MTSWALELCQKQTKRKRGQGGISSLSIYVCLKDFYFANIDSSLYFRFSNLFGEFI